MKIVYCIPATCNSRGMERVLATKANYLAGIGYEIIIVTTDQRGQPSFFPLHEKIKCIDLAINYEENNGKPIFNKLLKYPGKQLQHQKKLVQLLQKEKADIVISMFGNDESIIPKINPASKKILEIHFSKFKRIQYDRKGLWRLIDQWRSKQDEKIVKRFDKFVVLTEEDKSYWGQLANITVISNPRTFAPRATAALKNKKVIAVGGYTHQKGFDILIDIWAKVCKETDEWHLDIIGDGTLKEYYQEKIKSYAIGHSISLVKPTSHIEEHYAAASVLALTSRYEGLPMVLLEAQAFGLPVVAFECKCGPKDILTNNKDGYLLPQNDTDAFAQKLLGLMKNENLRIKMGKEAKDNSSRYSLEKIMQQWINLFNELVK